MSDLLEQYEREAGVQWLPWNMTSEDWQRRVDWLESMIDELRGNPEGPLARGDTHELE